ncbi:hypothetical protein BC831DRAFT_464775 [Entophlyctis helioformis]|nr:hypothetical protein BC831DRAFT_464775 [Entophlyctis helioformis]
MSASISRSHTHWIRLQKRCRRISSGGWPRTAARKRRTRCSTTSGVGTNERLYRWPRNITWPTAMAVVLRVSAVVTSFSMLAMSAIIAPRHGPLLAEPSSVCSVWVQQSTTWCRSGLLATRGGIQAWRRGSMMTSRSTMSAMRTHRPASARALSTMPAASGSTCRAESSGSRTICSRVDSAMLALWA